MHSATIAWGYSMAVIGVVLQFTDQLAALVGDDDFKAHLHTVIGDTKVWSYIVVAISVITILCRLRSIVKAD